MSNSTLLLVAIVGCGILPPLFMRDWRALLRCVLFGLGLSAALFAMLWVTADPRVFLARVNTVYALFAAAALLLGAAIRALLFFVWPPRQPGKRVSE